MQKNNLYKDSTNENLSEKIAIFLLKTNGTVRLAAKEFCLSKTTIHKKITINLKKDNNDLYKQIRILLDKNKAERHLRGGLATKNLYKKINQM